MVLVGHILACQTNEAVGIYAPVEFEPTACFGGSKRTGFGDLVRYPAVVGAVGLERLRNASECSGIGPKWRRQFDSCGLPESSTFS